MAAPGRNQIYAALFALMADVTIGGKPFVTQARKFKHFSKVPADQQPAFFQTEPDERITQRTRMPSLRTLGAQWVVYFSSNPSDDTDQPTVAMNDFVDALEAIFPDMDDPEGYQTLGGLVYHAYIGGDVLKVAGDDDGQGMLVIPIVILVP